MHRWLAQSDLPPSLGTKGWVLGSKVVSLLCISLGVCLWDAMQGTRGKLAPWAMGRRLTRSSRAQSCAASHAGSCSPLQYRAGQPFKLSACRGKHGTAPWVPYAHRSLLLPCCPAALARPGTCACTHPAALGGFEDTCKTGPLGVRVEGGQGRVHASSTVAVHPAPDEPLRKTTDYRLLNRGAPSSVSLCRSISTSLLLRDHVYSTLQTPSRAPSSQRPLPSPSLARSQAPTLSRRSQLPNCPIARSHAILAPVSRTHRDH